MLIAMPSMFKRRYALLISLAVALYACNTTNTTTDKSTSTTAGPVRKPAIYSAKPAATGKPHQRLAAHPDLKPPPALTRSQVESELETAESLLSQAEAFARNASSNQNATQWYEDDRAFQADLDRIARQINVRLARTPFDSRTSWDAVSFDVVHNLLQSEAFLFGAVQDAVAACNEGSANENLRVARADIKEARRDFNRSTPDPEGWEPPEVNPSGENLCQ
jgi:hypothetical protein